MRISSFALFVAGFLASEYDAAQKILSVVPAEYHFVAYSLAIALALAMLIDRYAAPALGQNNGGNHGGES